MQSERLNTSRHRRKIQLQKHLGKSRQYWRDIILGVNDGLVSTFLLVAGVAGGGLSSTDILLTAIAGAIAGAISMAAGEYVATKSQNEVMRGEINLEEDHVKNNLEEEMEELNELFEKIGLTLNEDDKADAEKEQTNIAAKFPIIEKSLDDQVADENEGFGKDKDTELDKDVEQGLYSMQDVKELQSNLKEFYRTNPKALLKIMKSLEFGVVDEETRSPIRAGAFSCVLFILGSLPSVLPFLFSGDSPTVGLIAAAIGTIICLMLVGMIKTWATRTKMWSAAIENLVIAGFGGGAAYGIGLMFETIIR
ncbi:hypothetical protein CTEN210_16388 [Chaetoceros tenuissimus]|uniref:Uncharacterized protein n=1 Tax=Chaetoceros tenuissimus TaxID=426638 RepID=A0AAD3HDJ2_9STRA|nr:hypothetical protein CTEN210_16388 [Chaetoceros tenuissimus]